MTVRLTASRRELIEYQRGVIARWQHTSCPGNLAAADALLRRGRWLPLYGGVYACHTGFPSRAAMLWAAVLRCGPDAVLSHHSAAELDQLADKPASAIYVTIPQRHRVSFAAAELAGGLPPIVSRRSVRLATARHPARTPPRTRIEETVLDLMDTAATFDEAFGWLTTACGRRLVTPGQLSVAAAARSRLRWSEDLRGALEEVEDGVMSGLERRFVRDVERPHGLPTPQRQARQRRGDVSSYLDNYYSDYALDIELDGLGAHPAEARWHDIHRDNANLAGAGIVTLRYSWADITQRSCQVADEIAAALRHLDWTGPLRRCPRCPATLAA
ncbi:MAG: hypothetical protein ACR2FU_24275 [Streptosporangiaceae bacterium]